MIEVMNLLFNLIKSLIIAYSLTIKICFFYILVDKVFLIYFNNNFSTSSGIITQTKK